MRFEFISDLEEDLDRLLKIGDEGATACRETPIFDNYSDSDNNPEFFSESHLGLTITTMPQGRFVYWKGMDPSELLEYDSRLMAFTHELPSQEGKPLSCINEQEEGSTELVEYSHTAETSPDRQVYMASLRNTEDDEPGPEYDAELLADVPADERTMDALYNKNEEHRRNRRLKNAKRAKRMQNTENCARNPLYGRNLNNAFVVAEDWEYRTPIGAPSSTTTAKPPRAKAAVLTQRALVQLDEQNSMSSTRNTLSRSEHHGDSAQVSRTPEGGARPREGGPTIASAGQSGQPRQSLRSAVRAWQCRPRGATTTATTSQPAQCKASKRSPARGQSTECSYG
jgi:hypothetical protein